MVNAVKSCQEHLVNLLMKPFLLPFLQFCLIPLNQEMVLLNQSR